MNTIHETDATPEAPDQPARRPGPAPSLLTRPDAPQLIAAIREGGASYRDLAARFGASPSAIHKLAQEVRMHDARRAGTPLPEPEPK